MEWVTDSLKRRCLQPELPYEVTQNAKSHESFAPRRAREARLLHQHTSSSSSISSSSSSSHSSSKSIGIAHGGVASTSTSTCGLFGGYSVLLQGQFPAPGPPRSDLQYLLARGSATIYASAEAFFTAAVQAKTDSKTVGNNRKYVSWSYTSLFAFIISYS